MPEFKLTLPDGIESASKDEQMQMLMDAYYKLVKELRFLLAGNLDQQNVLRAGSVLAENIDTVNAKITTAQIENLVVGDNITIGPNGVNDIKNMSIEAWIASDYSTYIDSSGVYTGIIMAQQIYTGDFTAINSIKLGNNDNVNKLLRLATRFSKDIILQAWTDVGPSLIVGATDSGSSVMNSMETLALYTQNLIIDSLLGWTVNISGSDLRFLVSVDFDGPVTGLESSGYATQAWVQAWVNAQGFANAGSNTGSDSHNHTVTISGTPYTTTSDSHSHTQN